MTDEKKPPTLRRTAEVLKECHATAVRALGEKGVPPLGRSVIGDGAAVAIAFLELVEACEAERTETGTLADGINAVLDKVNS